MLTVVCEPKLANEPESKCLSSGFDFPELDLSGVVSSQILLGQLISDSGCERLCLPSANKQRLQI